MASPLTLLLPKPQDFLAVVKSIEVRSAYGPTIHIDHPFTGPSHVSPVMQRLQPAITIDVEGYGPIDFTPYGQPPPTKWPLVKTAGIAAGLFGGMLMLLGLVGVIRGR